MTTWIGTNQAGWDNQSIGFHSVNGCTGLALSTPHWVAGWHIGGGAGGDYAGSGQTKAGFQAATFLNYIQAIHPNPWPAAGMPAGTVQLIVVYQILDGWATVLQEFATAIGYAGPARGFDVSGKTGTDSCDFKISHVNGDCTVQYKRTRKMDHVPQDDAQRGASVVRTLGSTGLGRPFQIMALTNNESHTADVKPTFFNGGNMHFVASRSYSTINV
jgi:hypothetical protein